MLRNYLKTSFRALWRKKTFSILNIVGLSVGMGACLVLFLVIRFERSYDTYHTKRDRIYRVTSAYTGGPEGNHFFQGVPIPLAPALREDFPQFERVASVDGVIDAQFTIPAPGREALKVKENRGVFYTEPDLFDIIDQPWLQGRPAALADPNTVALAATVAEGWFGDPKAAMGKTILLDHATPLRIVGILSDPPGNTDIPMRIVISYAGFPDRNNTNWHDTKGNFNCYALLAKGQDIHTVTQGFTAFAGKFYDNKGPGEKTSFYCQPLRDIHSDEQMGSFSGKRAPAELMWALALIGTFLVLIACINFINLATAQSVSRSKEIGVRKVLGSSRSRLVLQFLGETAVIVGLALLLACIFAELALPYFRNLLGEAIYLNLVQSPSILVFLLLAGLGVTLLGGLYPAFVLSGFDPVRAIKNNLGNQKGGGLFLRRGLVVFQFMIAQLMMIAMIVVMEQIDFLKRIPLGFDKDAIALVTLPTDSVSQARFAYTKERILALPGVIAASLCSDAPTSRRRVTSSFTFEDKQQDFGIGIRRADPDFFTTFHIALVAGRAPFESDTTREYLINETAAHKLGFRNAGDIIGKTLEMDGRYPIVGVMKDFSSGPPMSEIPPLVLSTKHSEYQYIAVRFDPTKTGEVMNAVQRTWQGIFPEYAYEQHFLDDNIAQYFTMADSAESLLRVFASIALLVSCLGLYGLVAFMVAQRTKEVGIRKVLGATVQSILVLFSREFTLLIGIAFLIAAPVGYYLMQQMLASIYHRISLGWGVFAWVIGVSLLIAWVTVGYRALRAALADPIKALKYE
jgi:predicted permease